MENQEFMNRIPFKESWEELTEEEINTAQKLMKEDGRLDDHPELLDDTSILLAFANNFKTKEGDEVDLDELISARLNAQKDREAYATNPKILKYDGSNPIVETPGDREKNDSEK